MPTILIAGASRGIGLEFARVHAARGDTVIATCRDDAGAARIAEVAPKATVLRLDTTDPASIATLVAQLPPLDRAVINAGVFGPRSYSLATVETQEWLDVLNTNVVGPLRLATQLLDRVSGTIAFLSSRMGSIAQSGGGQPIYRASKAALNAGMKSIAVERAGLAPILLVLHPGWVKTEMGGAGADIDVATSVAGMVAVIDRAKPTDSGSFFNYTGEILPW